MEPLSDEDIPLNILLRPVTLALSLALLGGTAEAADSGFSRYGTAWKSEDGQRSYLINARLQYDAVRFDDDRLAERASFESRDGSYYRRGYVTFNARAGQWGLRLENDFAIDTSLKAVREMWISHPLAGGEIVIGQHKPFRGLEELSSSNELSLMERPFFATTMFGDNISRQFQPGLFWRRPLWPTAMLQLSVYNANHGLGQPVGRGFGTANRLSWYPVNSRERMVYLAAAAGHDQFVDEAPGSRSARYAGRSSAGGNVVGPSQRVLVVGEDAGQTWGGFEAVYGVGPLHLQGEVLLSAFEDARGPGRDDRVLS